MPCADKRSTKNMARANQKLTDMPGVYLNDKGYYCNEYGVALSVTKLREADNKRWEEICGAVPETPADFLRAASMDPRLSMEARVKAAAQAAPYFNQKKPIAVEDVTQPKGTTVDIQKLALLDKKERQTLLDLLTRVGVAL